MSIRSIPSSNFLKEPFFWRLRRSSENVVTVTGLVRAKRDRIALRMILEHPGQGEDGRGAYRLD
jgi:hypothetical protein